MENEKKEINFEKSLARLEEIVASLENGDCELDKSLALFEEGVSLVNSCKKKLDEATQRVNILTSEGEVPFDADKND